MTGGKIYAMKSATSLPGGGSVLRRWSENQNGITEGDSVAGFESAALHTDWSMMAAVPGTNRMLFFFTLLKPSSFQGN